MNKITQKTPGFFTCNHEFIGYQGSKPYFTLSDGGPIDGIGREHLQITCACDKCSERILVGYTHRRKKSQDLRVFAAKVIKAWQDNTYNSDFSDEIGEMITQDLIESIQHVPVC